MLLPFFAAVALPADSSDASRVPELRHEYQIEQLANTSIKRGFLPGMSVAVIRSNDGSFSRHFGLASLEPKRPITAATRFRLGSISKLVTGAIVLKLSEDGRIDLDTPASKLLADDPVFAKLPAEVTVERLLNHTSGLPDFTRDELEAKVARGVSTDDDLRIVLRRPSRAPAGQQWAYADAPFRILSRVVERATGQSFGAYVSTRLAPALRLPTLALCEPGRPDHAVGYVAESGTLRPEPAYSIRGLLGEGGLCANVEDLAKLPVAIARSGWLSQSSLARLTAPTRLADGMIVDYGLGVRRGLLGPYKAWGHTGGGLHGSWAAVAYYPEAGLSVAVVANGTGGDVDAATLQARVAATVLGVEAPRTTAPEVRLVERVVGTYSRGDQTTCLYSSGNDLLRTKLGATASPTPLFHQEDSTFARLDYPLDRFVFQVEGPTAVGYRVYYDGMFAEHWRRSPERTCEGRAKSVETPRDLRP